MQRREIVVGFSKNGPPKRLQAYGAFEVCPASDTARLVPSSTKDYGDRHSLPLYRVPDSESTVNPPARHRGARQDTLFPRCKPTPSHFACKSFRPPPCLLLSSRPIQRSDLLIVSERVTRRQNGPIKRTSIQLLPCRPPQGPSLR